MQKLRHQPLDDSHQRRQEFVQRELQRWNFLQQQQNLLRIYSEPHESQNNYRMNSNDEDAVNIQECPICKLTFKWGGDLIRHTYAFHDSSISSILAKTCPTVTASSATVTSNPMSSETLNNEIKTMIKSAMGPGNPGDVLVDGLNAEVTRADIAVLLSSICLNDELVNFYFNLIKERNGRDDFWPKVHVFNSFFYPKFVKEGYAGVKRWTKKIDIFSFELIFIPVHQDMHWSLIVVDFKRKHIGHYDYLKYYRTDIVIQIKQYLNYESWDKKHITLDFAGWSQWIKSIPKENSELKGGCQCGVFMCIFAKNRSRHTEFKSSHENAHNLREKIMYEVLTKRLL